MYALTRFRTLLLVVAISALTVGLLPAMATAQTAAVVEGEASLPEFPSAGNQGDFAGTATGLCQGTVGVLANATATNFNYNDATIVLGTANGTLNVAGCGSFPFTWTRVGATAVVTIPGGGALCVFVATEWNVNPPNLSGSLEASVACVAAAL